MTIPEIVLMILFGVIIVGGYIYVLIRLILKNRDLSNQLLMMNQENQKLEEKLDKVKDGEYSEEILKFIRNIIGQIAIIKCQNYIDGHNIEKSTRIQIQAVAEDVAIASHNAILLEKIDTDRLMFPLDFLDTYIVEIAISDVKAVFNKVIDEY